MKCGTEVHRDRQAMAELSTEPLSNLTLTPPMTVIRLCKS